MREVNFSIPNVNKASVGITTALYDRRALDCTSTLPLINSLNHLAYLTTSSARIRDILTIDGGVERLVCILKQGRNQEMMEMWKWNLAFQCVVNIGVRGSEGVRTRVVEADMVPVIATILDNYIKVVDMHREQVDADTRRRELQLQQREQQEQQRQTSAELPRNSGEIASEASAANENLDEPMVDVQATVEIQGVEDQDAMADAMATPLGLTAQNVSEGQDAETFNITHRSPIDGSIINTNIAPTPPNIGFPPAPPPLNVVNNQPPPAVFVPQNIHARYLLYHSAPPGIQAAMPRDEDVLLSLQLLAYVSKYCTLRSYFQESHLVPNLKIDPKLKISSPPQGLDEVKAAGTNKASFDPEEEEYLLPDDFNIFPLVEKFT
ncbi:MAG: hypothetical protein Q9207_000493 [Kuettlingeria erythrocarpa]